MKRLISIFISLLLVFSITIPSFATEQQFISYTLSSEEMLALLNASTCKYEFGLTSGTSYTGTLSFSQKPTGDSGIYAIIHSASGGPNADVSFIFDFPIDINCKDISITSAFGIQYYNIDDHSVISDVRPTSGNLNLITDTHVTGTHSSFNATLNTSSITAFPVLVTQSSWTHDSLAHVTGFSSIFHCGWGGNQPYDMIFSINPITYTGLEPEIDTLVNKLNQLIDSGKDNTDRIIENQDKNTEEIKDKIWDSTYQAGTHIMENQDKNTEKILDDINTSKPEDVEKLEDYQNSVDSVQSEADEISSALDSVEEPDLDSIDFDITKDLDGSSVSPMFDIIFGDTFILSLISFSIIISVLSLLLFGKM